MDQANALRDKIRLRQESFDTSTKRSFNTSEINRRKSPKLYNSRIMAITSGKGGSGKTNLALNMAIVFRQLGKKVIIIDADFGLANIEVLFGLSPKYTLQHVFSGEKKIDEVITEGPLGVKFLSGGSGLAGLANISEAQMDYVIKNLIYLDIFFDLIIIDTGAGISKMVINFVKACKEVIIVTTPEPTAITDAYALIKASTGEFNTPMGFKLIVNRVEDTKEGDEVFYKLNKVSEKFLGTSIENLGYLPEDNALVKAVKKQNPVLLSYPKSEISKAIENICLRLMNLEPKNDSQGGIISYVKKLIKYF